MGAHRHRGRQRARFELGTDGPATIVVGVDETDSSRRAAAYATGIARRHQATIVFAYARSLGTFDGLNAGVVNGLREAHEAVAAEIRGLTEMVREQLGVDAQYVELWGDPVGQLSHLVKERRADLLVVGASQRRGHRVAGSVAHRMVRAGILPVTVVP